MDILGKIFGNVARARVMRLFLLNQESVYTAKEIARKTKVQISKARKEASFLENIGLLRKVRHTQSLSVVSSPDRMSTRKSSRRKVHSRPPAKDGWQIEPSFPFLQSLRLLFNADLLYKHKHLGERIRRCGKIQFLAVAGIFLNDSARAVDLVIVGDNLRRPALDRIVGELEAEVGKELNYAVLDTEDFRYRLNAHDRFVRDLFDYPHERLINKLGI